MVIAPRKNQSEDQKKQDEIACSQWATDRTGISPETTDPEHAKKQTQALTPKTIEQQQAPYEKADRACLEEKGYST